MPERLLLTGNHAAAYGAMLSRAEVISAYPITPQTHTVEYISQFVNDGDLDCRLVKVESEHSALSACAGAAAVGARTFTASCSQGLQLMSEVMYFTSGMRFPVVMAIATTWCAAAAALPLKSSVKTRPARASCSVPRARPLHRPRRRRPDSASQQLPILWNAVRYLESSYCHHR